MTDVYTRNVRPTDTVESFLDGSWKRLPDPAGFKVIETKGQPFRLVYLDHTEVPAPWRVTAHGLWQIEEIDTWFAVRVALRDGRRALLAVQAFDSSIAVDRGYERFQADHPELSLLGAATVSPVIAAEAAALNAAYAESFQTENALSGENGGGGNRTRVTCHPDSQPLQEVPVSSLGDEPRPRLADADSRTEAAR
jgi:hypothetical protein